MKSIRSNSMIGVCAIALTIPAQVFAQTAAAPAQAAVSEFEATEIIVTARRRDERLQDVPSVINVVTGEQVAKLNFRELGEIQRLAPGLELTTNANGTGGNARLRGVNFDVNASGNNPTVEFYLNDAPITSGGGCPAPSRSIPDS